MEREAFALLSAAEQAHWWFRGRRDFIDAAIRRVAPPPGANLLDAGCGSGGNLELLARFGQVFGFEADSEAVHQAQHRRVGDVAPGRMPDTIPFPDGPRFDVIGLFDVLEHLEQPVASLCALGERLAPGGAIVLTVPALPLLWGPHDVRHRHVRRYTRAELMLQLSAAGMYAEYLTSFNMLLLPAAIIQRMRERWLGYRTDRLMPPSAVNALLYRIWRLELGVVPRYSLPIGLSLLAIVRKRDG